MDQDLWRLIGKKISGDATVEELEELNRIQERDPDVAYYIEEILSWWRLAEKVGAEVAGKAFLEHLERMEGKSF
ncbi:MAG TPA: hypothetical protein VNR87_14085 [Flavisolibacter sp.]|nr:hypothetical protein [Flavisolibacter sp.]